MRILICGSRNYNNSSLIASFINSLNTTDDTVINGGAAGADSIAAQIAKDKNIKVETYFADWATYGKAAGPIRNQQMIVEGKPDLIVAYTDDLVSSRGTKNMVTQGKGYDIPTYLNADSIINIEKFKC